MHQNKLHGISKIKSDKRISPRRKAPVIAKPKTIDNNIRVVVRIRPPNAKENGDNSRNIVTVVDDTEIIFDPREDSTPFFYQGIQQKHRDLNKRLNKHMKFIFDSVFDFESTNDEIFKNSTKCLINSLMDGYNCSVFAYGATGAGKTHTMLGNIENPGITVLTMEELFAQKDALSAERDFDLGISYLEVYNELVQDLLVPGKPLNLREDGKFGVVVAGIQIKKILKAEELFSLLEQGNKNRTQHPTDANAESSRSHAVFQVYIRMKIRKTGEVRLSKLSMIDLAGSERGAATGFSGARFTEGANINKSLLALGNCINSLADKKSHIPYRDSKLTRLLKDSLGGNCQTVMIANVSPSSLSYDDTFNTLKYATRAKQIKYNIKKNVVNNLLGASQYQKIVEDLSKEVEQLKAELELANTKNKEAEAKIEILEKENYKLKTTVQEESNKDDDNMSYEEELEAENDENKITSSLGALSTTIIVPNDQSTRLDALLEELQALINERYTMLDNLLSLNYHKKYLSIRAELKQSADSRLSDLCVDSPDKIEGHQRLRNTVNSLFRQAEMTRNDAVHIEVKLKELNKRILDLSAETECDHRFNECIKTGELQLEILKNKHLERFLEKIQDLFANNRKMMESVMEQMANVLQPCFLSLRAEGKVSSPILKQYKNLVKNCQGIRSITWNENVATATFESSSPFTSPNNARSPRVPFSPSPNHITDEAKLSQLNDTFTKEDEDSQNIPTSKNGISPRVRKGPRTVLGDRLVINVRDNIGTAKAFKKPQILINKVKPLGSASANGAKPNLKTILKNKPTSTMGTAQRFPIYQSPNTRTAGVKINNRNRLNTPSPSPNRSHLKKKYY